MGSLVRNTVVVIDDDIATYKALCRIGRQEEFAVIAFSSGREFFGWFEACGESAVLGNYAMCIVLDARKLAADTDWCVQDWARTVPKICIGVPDMVKSIIDVVNVLEGEFIRRPFTLDELTRRVNEAFERGAEIQRSRQEDMRISQRYSTLSSRENEVFGLVALGRTNLEISELLGISIKTVKVHRAKVMKKTQSETLADLVRNYEKREFILGHQKLTAKAS